MNPCLKCNRDEDYCHGTGQDEYCQAWQAWKIQVLIWLGEIKRTELLRKQQQRRLLSFLEEVTADDSEVSRL
jgi:hypothetical protein